MSLIYTYSCQANIVTTDNIYIKIYIKSASVKCFSSRLDILTTRLSTKIGA